MTKKFKIAVLPGDGIGKEVVEQAVKVLNAVGEKYNRDFELNEAPVGYEAYKQHKTCLPKETLDLCRKSDAILLGAVGTPEADKLQPDERPERAALMPLRKKFDLFANLRPVKVFKQLANASTLKPEILEEGFDMVIVRELTSGIYFGKHKRGQDYASDEMIYRKKEVERIAKVAFELAMKRRKKVTSIDKANVLTSMIYWREVVEEVAKKYTDIEFNSLYVDNAAMQLVRYPAQFDVMLCGNMFGDILSDEASMISGSIGMLPSASMNEKGFGLYEPIHGSAPDIAGKDKANPCATILSTAMMLRHSFGLEAEAKAIEDAVEAVLEQGYRTADIMQENRKLLGAREMGEEIAKKIQ